MAKKKEATVHARRPRKAGWKTLLDRVPEMKTSEARKFFADVLLDTAEGRVVIVRYQRPLAAIVPLQDAALLELLSSPRHRATLKLLRAELKAL